MNRKLEVGSVWIFRYPGQYIYFYAGGDDRGFRVKSSATVLVLNGNTPCFIKVLVGGKIAFVDKMWFTWEKHAGSSLWSEKVQSHEDCVRMNA